MTTEPTGPANTEDDPLGPSAPSPEPTGEPRTPGTSAPSRHDAGNIREARGTSPGGTVPADPSDKDTLEEPESADGPGQDRA